MKAGGERKRNGEKLAKALKTQQYRNETGGIG
jgi:hypothetical protein